MLPDKLFEYIYFFLLLINHGAIFLSDVLYHGGYENGGDCQG